MKVKKVYICSALRGDMENNIRLAKCYCEYAVREHGVLPIAPHIYFTQFLDDGRKEEREFGLRAGLLLLSLCAELWYFGDAVTAGMAEELRRAAALGIRVWHVPQDEYEDYTIERKRVIHEIQ